jgi:hypothetical protein
MHTCPFCKSAVPQLSGPCPRCGKQLGPASATQVQGGGRALDDGWGDDGSDALSGGLDLSRGGSMAAGVGASGPSAYSGGGLSLGDDDDPFADDAAGGSLELDIPSHHTAQSTRSMPAGSNPSGQPPPGGQQQHHQQHQAGGGVPDLVMPPPRSSNSLGVGPVPPPPPSSQPSFSGPPSSQPQVSAPPVFGQQQSQPQFDQPPPSQPHVAPQQPQQHEPPQPPRPPPPPDPAAMIARFPTPPQKIWEAPIYAIRVCLRQLELRQDLASLRKKRSPDVALYERALRTHDEKTFMVGLAITGAAIFVASFIFFLPVILRFLRAPD